MSAPLSTTDQPSGGARPRGESESHAWQELEDVFAALGQLARSAVPPAEFYRNLLDQSVRSLSATGGVVWLRAAGESMQAVAQSNWPRNEFGSDEATRRAHETLLADAAADGRVVTIAPHSRSNERASANSTNHALLLAPVNISQSEGQSQTRAIIELLLRPDASPATYRGCEQFLTAVCELAVDYHAFYDLRGLRENDRFRNDLLRLGHDAHCQLGLSETAYAVANEGRSVIGCDRLSVLVARGRHCRLLTTSGVSRIERRSGAARRLASIAEQVRRTDEAAFYADGESDALPPVAEALEQHAEESHGRQIAAIPLRRPEIPHQAEDQSAKKRASRRRERPQFVIVAEQFDARGIDRDRLVEVAEVCTTALYNAWDVDRLPLGWLTRPLGTIKHQITSHLPRTVFVVAAVAAAVAALFMVPADFNIEASGTLQPIVRRDVFAPRSGLIDEVLVSHGQAVKQGEPLVRMRDPALELEIKRVDGELLTAQRQIDAVRVTRTNRAIRDEESNDGRLSAEERELQQRLENLRLELDLLRHEREQLVVEAPISGRVLTWEVSHRLAARPIDRGEVLLTVADLDDKWHLELDVLDDRIGYVLAAQQSIQTDLPVRFKLSSDDREQHTGHIQEVCQTASIEETPGVTPSPTVLVKVALDKLELTGAARRELRPGVSARAEIACGRAAIGYVWFHDLWDTVVEWATF
jgi:multidrug efflux pump subunit AcrA (membrane-fusion protein)